MKVFVTGGTGYIGNAVVAALCRAGHDVSALTRRLDQSDLIERFGARAVKGDIAEPEGLAPFVKEAGAVTHAAAEPSPEMGAIARRLVAVLLDAVAESDGLRRFVYTSGVWVLGNTGGRMVDESAPTANATPMVAWRPAVEEMIGNGMARGITAGRIPPGRVRGGARGGPP